MKLARAEHLCCLRSTLTIYESSTFGCFNGSDIRIPKACSSRYGSTGLLKFRTSAELLQICMQNISRSFYNDQLAVTSLWLFDGNVKSHQQRYPGGRGSSLFSFYHFHCYASKRMNSSMSVGKNNAYCACINYSVYKTVRGISVCST